MIEKIIASINSIKSVKSCEFIGNDIKVYFDCVLYFNDEEVINNSIKKYKKIAEIGQDFYSVIIRDIV